MLKQTRVIFSLTTALSVFFALSTGALAEHRVALVIGNSGYEHTPALTNPANDAEDVAKSLRDVGFDVTLKLDANKRQFDQSLAEFTRAAKNADSALFYYAGHGMQYQGRNFVVPTDAELKDEVSLRDEAVPIDDVKAALSATRGVRIMVLDSCRNNPLADRFVRSVSSNTRDLPKVQG